MVANPQGSNFWNAISKTTQAFILALIIISAYVVFFAWVMVTAPQDKGIFNYSGMRDLTATFGIIAAAVVGYYFGQKNLEEATKTAQSAAQTATQTAESATNIAKQAKDEVEIKKDDLKKEKENIMTEIENGIPIYSVIGKLLTSAAQKPSEPIEKILKEEEIDLNSLKTTVENRINHLETMKKTKEDQVKVLKSSIS